ncbi:hypothetical protein EGW08_016892 [Elysia chlorotica]|uniref:Uncharacterized protein n=1 Tax=Elysia chlorotica TaxID=188477 RepID=A0A433T1H9_ELYCH|nr:hypothetical protein EGW08_016892 [Elysia chlorotica]
MSQHFPYLAPDETGRNGALLVGVNSGRAVCRAIGPVHWSPWSDATTARLLPDCLLDGQTLIVGLIILTPVPTSRERNRQGSNLDLLRRKPMFYPRTTALPDTCGEGVCDTILSWGIIWLVADYDSLVELSDGADHQADIDVPGKQLLCMTRARPKLPLEKTIAPHVFYLTGRGNTGKANRTLDLWYRFTKLPSYPGQVM